jgi:methyltransferase
MESATLLFLGFIVCQRLTELVIADYNTRRLLARGAREAGASHYPLMVAMHGTWLGCLLIFGYHQMISYGWLAVFAVLQALRVWIIATLGRRWTTRIIVTSEPLIKSGPFRYFRHPNYMLVVAEIIVAPMVVNLPVVALVFTILNAAMLRVRITAEDAALGATSQG